ncbi:MAG: acetyl-CoA carboxylase biotin carboxyl carrier protein [Candidatus Hydrogenedentes bacterium]|nr:acetyl-CoA carboxylase biotin carboxyl carrier protein [Candidatus Hydrogenedentota bacterium]
MDLDKLRELIGIFQESGLSEIEFEEEGRRIRLTKSLPVAEHPQHVIAHVPAVAPSPGPSAAVPAPGVISTVSTEAEHDESLVTIESPMVGVFYGSPSPGEPPFVKAGDIIEENQAVCIVEAMKLMNEVASKFKCEIVNVLVENGEPVEYGQPMFAVRLVE